MAFRRPAMVPAGAQWDPSVPQVQANDDEPGDLDGAFPRKKRQNCGASSGGGFRSSVLPFDVASRFPHAPARSATVVEGADGQLHRAPSLWSSPVPLPSEHAASIAPQPGDFNLNEQLMSSPNCGDSADLLDQFGPSRIGPLTIPAGLFAAPAAIRFAVGSSSSLADLLEECRGVTQALAAAQRERQAFAVGLNRGTTAQYLALSQKRRRLARAALQESCGRSEADAPRAAVPGAASFAPAPAGGAVVGGCVASVRGNLLPLEARHLFLSGPPGLPRALRPQEIGQEAAAAARSRSITFIAPIIADGAGRLHARPKFPTPVAPLSGAAARVTKTLPKGWFFSRGDEKEAPEDQQPPKGSASPRLGKGSAAISSGLAKLVEIVDDPQSPPTSLVARITLPLKPGWKAPQKKLLSETIGARGAPEDSSSEEENVEKKSDPRRHYFAATTLPLTLPLPRSTAWCGLQKNRYVSISRLTYKIRTPP